MIHEKDNILQEALEYIVTVRFEGQATNQDFLNYWKYFTDNICNVSTASFRAGITSFYDRLKKDNNSRELMGYHFRLMTTLINNHAVISAADELFTVIAHNLREEVDNDVIFDLMKGKDQGMYILSGFEKIMLMMHIYQDRIDCAISALLPPPAPPKRGFRP